MRIECKATDALTDTDRAGLEALRLAVYPPEAEPAPGWARFTWAPTEWHFLVHDDTDAIVSHVGTLTRPVLVAGAVVRIGGIGGVQTHPDARGRGYASAAMERAQAYFLDEELPFALLFCHEQRVSFYAALGWQRFTGHISVAQPEGTITFMMNETLVRSVHGEAPTTGALDLQGLPW